MPTTESVAKTTVQTKMPKKLLLMRLSVKIFLKLSVPTLAVHDWSEIRLPVSSTKYSRSPCCCTV